MSKRALSINSKVGKDWSYGDIHLREEVEKVEARGICCVTSAEIFISFSKTHSVVVICGTVRVYCD